MHSDEDTRYKPEHAGQGAEAGKVESEAKVGLGIRNEGISGFSRVYP